MGLFLALPAAVYGYTSAAGQGLTGVGQLYFALTGKQANSTYMAAANFASTPLSTVLYAAGPFSNAHYQAMSTIEGIGFAGSKGTKKALDLALSFANIPCKD